MKMNNDIPKEILDQLADLDLNPSVDNINSILSNIDSVARGLNSRFAESNKTETLRQSVLAVLFFCIPALTVSTILWQWL